MFKWIEHILFKQIKVTQHLLIFWNEKINGKFSNNLFYPSFSQRDRLRVANKRDSTLDKQKGYKDFTLQLA